MQTVSPLMCASLRIMGVECRSAAITDVVDSLGCLPISFGDGQTGLHFHFVVFISCSINPSHSTMKPEVMVASGWATMNFLACPREERMSCRNLST
jgi:hypothetical protein